MAEPSRQSPEAERLSGGRLRLRSDQATALGRAAIRSRKVVIVEALATPSMRSGRKWRWKAATTASVCASKVPDRGPVAVHREHGLERLNRLAVLAAREEAAVADRRGPDPVADARLVQPRPGEALAGILLAAGRDVGVTEHAFRRDRPARGDVPAQPDHARDLRLPERGQPAVMATRR